MSHRAAAAAVLAVVSPLQLGDEDLADLTELLEALDESTTIVVRAAAEVLVAGVSRRRRQQARAAARAASSQRAGDASERDRELGAAILAAWRAEPDLEGNAAATARRVAARLGLATTRTARRLAARMSSRRRELASTDGVGQTDT